MHSLNGYSERKYYEPGSVRGYRDMSVNRMDFVCNISVLVGLMFY